MHRQIEVVIFDLVQFAFSYRLSANVDFELSLCAISNWFLVLFSLKIFLLCLHFSTTSSIVLV